MSTSEKQVAITLVVEKFRADSTARNWAVFYLVLLDASFWPASTDIEVLKAAIGRLGVAGVVGIEKVDDETGRAFAENWYDTAESARALASVADYIADAVNGTTKLMAAPSSSVN
jgi:hypothetical protein